MLLASYVTSATVRVVQGSACSHTEVIADEIRRIDDSVHTLAAQLVVNTELHTEVTNI